MSIILQFLYAKLTILPSIFRPGYDAIFSSLPWSQRWRLLPLVPINLLAALITSPSWLFNHSYTVLYIPTRSGPRRCLVYKPPALSAPSAAGSASEGKEAGRLRPLHIDIHGGGFLGGLAEANARWCNFLASRTNAVVISCQYRAAPRHTFPAAHNDIEDILSWILTHAESHFGADRELLTLGGSSAGGSLALSAAMWLHLQKERGSVIEVLALVAFCPALDFRIKPEDKPKPSNFPAKDPLAFLVPLFDAYAGPARMQNLTNPRLNPIIADKNSLPRNVLLIVAGIDILMYEQLAFVERVRRECEEEGDTERRVEAKVFEKGFHGWIELPKSILEEERMEAFEACVRVIRDVHRAHGWKYNP
ncbi:alpha/beta-hydrolase [Lojkania enalia]|uniref:Alpha/beta-hydrolase n=1 Tax=Lojkania enalia TaxID=147567 RepID=A0A9P4N9M2_9PLEO|nr:alpha/beta-hydrolase [Didymosphaeria enalia]